ncbi:DUF5343 domain-containing protein [Flavobacterium aestivum]|uniref:DUF5343 domain-containing protein n=1 Tax=Flavobacterium aestivum TaxID=3003257 RepID=UPI00248288AE|nr:DUF5343 domain-containing protein [Flavobacterium aestivum]
MKKIIEGTAPEKFTIEHLKKLGFKSSNDYTSIGVLKDLGFLSENGNPTQVYHEYRNSARSKHVLGNALKETYSDIFHLTEKPSVNDKSAITGLFKTTHNVSDQVAGFMANTFLTLLEMADVNHTSKPVSITKEKQIKEDHSPKEIQQSKEQNFSIPVVPNLRYNIEIHLPATKDIEVYNSIFKSLKEHLLND